MKIDNTLIRRLVASQFPQWENQPIRRVSPGGWDHRIFRLGEEMLVRMPSAAEYAFQVEKEHHWLPQLAPLLPLPIPEPLAMGEPEYGFPWKWSIYRWIEGEPATSGHIENSSDFACTLAQFLIALQLIDSTDGPSPGPHNFYRGGSLATYNAETRQAISDLKNKIDVNTATEIWEAALETHWKNSPVWIHGDIAASNLLVKDGRLSAVIDFGMLGIGDPACDLAIAWTLFRGQSREVFRSMLALDKDTWLRGSAWTLWKALIIAAGLTKTNAIESTQSFQIIEDVLADYQNNALQF